MIDDIIKKWECSTLIIVVWLCVGLSGDAWMVVTWKLLYVEQPESLELRHRYEECYIQIIRRRLCAVSMSISIIKCRYANTCASLIGHMWK